MNLRQWKEDEVGNFPHDTSYYGSGGGGKGDMAMMAMMMQQQQAEQIRASQQKRIDDDIKAAQKAEQERKDAAEAVAKKERGISQLNKTYAGAQGYGNQQLAQYGGTDRWGLLDAYNALLGNAKNMIPEDDPNPSSYINAQDLWSQASNQQRGLQRSKLRSGYNAMYPAGFDTRTIADEMDDPVLESIMGDQVETSRQSLDRARARGQLNDEAYGYAQNLFGTQQNTARNTLQGLGQTVLQRYRDSLKNRATNYKTRAEEWDFGDDLNAEQEQADYNTELNRDRTNLETDVRGAVGDRELFNMDLLLGKARNRAGTENATGTGSPLVSAFANTPTTQTDTRADDPTKRQVGVF